MKSVQISDLNSFSSRFIVSGDPFEVPVFVCL